MKFLLDNGYEAIKDFRKETVSLDVDGIVDNILYNIPEGEKKKYSILVSDTHNNLLYIKSLIQVANKSGIKHIMHCGDIVSDEALECFSKFKGKFYVVYGNHDLVFTHKYKLNRVSEHHGFMYNDKFTTINHMNKQIILTHGNYPQIIIDLIQKDEFDFMLIGHYHQRLLYWKRETNKYVINPGAFTNNKMHIDLQHNIPSFVLFPINPNSPNDIIFYQIPKKKI